MNVEIISTLIKLIILIAAALATRYAVPYIETKIGADKLALICEYAALFVSGVEQKFKESGKGQEKLEEVTTLLSEKAKSIGLILTADDIRLIIEDAVKEMKS